MITLVGNPKGGVGKSTIAVNIASARAMIPGRRVLLVDGDDPEQRSSADAILFRMQAEGFPGIASANWFNGDELRTQVQHQRALFDDIIIDAGGDDGGALRAGMMICDKMVVPYAPKAFETRALRKLQSLIDLCNEARREMKRQPIEVLAFLNRAKPGVNNTINLQGQSVIEHFPLLKLIEPKLVHREAFSDAAAMGISVFEHKPRDAKACDELKALLAAIYGDQ